MQGSSSRVLHVHWGRVTLMDRLATGAGGSVYRAEIGGSLSAVKSITYQELGPATIEEICRRDHSVRGCTY